MIYYRRSNEVPESRGLIQHSGGPCPVFFDSPKKIHRTRRQTQRSWFNNYFKSFIYFILGLNALLEHQTQPRVISRVLHYNYGFQVSNWFSEWWFSIWLRVSNWKSAFSKLCCLPLLSKMMIAPQSPLHLKPADQIRQIHIIKKDPGVVLCLKPFSFT